MLTPDQLRDVIAQGEQLDVEFRGESEHAVSDADLVETVSCLANARGGLVLVGVEDDGRITGARPRHGTYTDPRRLELTIANQTAPACSVECGVVSVDGKEIVVVSIPPEQPVTATVAGVYRRRATDVHGKWKCVPFLPHEMQSREASRGAIDHSALVVPQARWEDLDPLELERLRQTIARNAGRADAGLLNLPDVEIARALGLAVGGRITIAGLLMVGREESVRQLIPTHEVAFQVMSGLRVAVNEFYRLPLIRVAEVIRERFDARNEEEELAVGSVSVGVPRYSPAGFREALHNALIHRDYTSLGAVHVQWGEGEIEISNPGGFPAEVQAREPAGDGAAAAESAARERVQADRAGGADGAGDRHDLRGPAPVWAAGPGLLAVFDRRGARRPPRRPGELGHRPVDRSAGESVAAVRRRGAPRS